MSSPAVLRFQLEGINWMKDFKVTNAALTVNSLNRTPERVKPLRKLSSTLAEFPFLLPLHSYVTGEKKKKEKRNDSDHMFTLHPREPAAQIILKSSLRFAPTSLTLAAEACSPTIHQG